MTCGRAPFLREGGFLKRGISWWKHSLKLELRGYFYESQFELRSISMGVKWSYGNIPMESNFNVIGIVQRKNNVILNL